MNLLRTKSAFHVLITGRIKNLVRRKLKNQCWLYRGEKDAVEQTDYESQLTLVLSKSAFVSTYFLIYIVINYGYGIMSQCTICETWTSQTIGYIWGYKKFWIKFHGVNQFFDRQTMPFWILASLPHLCGLDLLSCSSISSTSVTRWMYFPTRCSLH